MDISWKNRLQEYCQKKKLPFPDYRFRQQTNTPNGMRFQVEVYVNGRWYVGEENCSSKKEAEHSAAQKAFADLTKDYQEQPDIGPSDHLPPEYAPVEDFIATMLIPFGAHIRKIKPPDTHGRYRFEIGGNYRYCKNIERHHKKNQVYFLVDPVRKIYFQKCYDPECQGYQSAKQPIYINSTVNEKPSST